MKINCKIKGLNDLKNRTNEIIKELPQKVKENVKDILKTNNII